MPTPGPEHGILMEMVGRWNVDCTYFMGPGEPMKTQATETIEAVGAFWTVSLFDAEFMGQPFQGRCVMGFDQKRGKWVGTWIDSMSSHLFVMEGDMDPGTKALEMHCEGPAPMTGELIPYRNVSSIREDGKRQFDMFMTLPDAGEVQMFSYVYTRAE
jgi:hypothetical protein